MTRIDRVVAFCSPLEKDGIADKSFHLNYKSCFVSVKMQFITFIFIETQEVLHISNSQGVVSLLFNNSSDIFAITTKNIL